MHAQTPTTLDATTLVAQLNDLLQLDHDAVAAYGLAIANLRNEALRQTLRGFLRDHERHIEDLGRLVSEQGGVPVRMPHLPTGAFKLAMQAIGTLGGDRETLLAFKANERQVRDKYRRAAQMQEIPQPIRDVIERAAQDEARHYAWALEMLEDLGAGSSSTAGRVERVVEDAHARVADAVEGVERGAMAAADSLRQSAGSRGRANPVQSVLIALGAGIVAAQLLGRDRR